MKYIIILLILLYPVMSSESTGFKSIIERECRKNNIPVKLWTNLIQAESSGNPGAIGKIITIRVKGKPIKTQAIGLCQIVPEWHYAGKPKEDLFNPEINIKTGIKVYKNCLRRSKGSVVLALRYYNGQVKNKDDKYINKILKNV